MTTLLDSVTARIGEQVPALAGRIEGIADLAALIQAGALPQGDIAAFVVPLGFDDRGGDSASTAYTQMLDCAVGVVLCAKARGDVRAKRALPTIDQLSKDVVNAVAGWAPDEAVGVFRAARGRLLSADNGLVIYQLDFALLDQLRIF